MSRAGTESRQPLLVIGMGAYLYGKEKRVIRYFRHSAKFRPFFFLSIWSDGSVETELRGAGFPFLNRYVGIFSKAHTGWTLYTLLRAPLTALSLLRAYRRHGCRGVLVADIGTLGLLWPGVVLLRLLWRAPVTLYVGDMPQATRRKRLLGWLVTQLRAPVIAVSDAIRRRFLEFGIPAARIAVVHNGIDVQAQAPSAPLDFRAMQGWPAGDTVFGFVGQVTAGKGVDVFVAAAERLLREGVPARFVVIGRSEGDAALRERLVAHQRAWPQHFALCGDLRPIEPAYAGLDVLVVPSLREPLGNVVLEGMAAGRPVIGSATGGIPELIVDGVTGLLVPPGDADALAAAMRRLARDAGLRATLGDAGRRRIAAAFDVRKLVPRIDAAIALR